MCETIEYPVLQGNPGVAKSEFFKTHFPDLEIIEVPRLSIEEGIQQAIEDGDDEYLQLAYCALSLMQIVR